MRPIAPSVAFDMAHTCEEPERWLYWRTLVEARGVGLGRAVPRLVRDQPLRRRPERQRRRVGDGDALRALHEVGVDPRRLAGELDVLEPAEQLLEDRADLHAGEVGAEAEVAAEAEGEVAGRVLPADVEAERVGEDLVVAVGRRVREVAAGRRAGTSRRRSVNGSWQVRMKCFTGDTQRMSSSAAWSISSGCACSSSSWSGCSIRASRPPAIAFDVVSCPAVAMIR